MIGIRGSVLPFDTNPMFTTVFIIIFFFSFYYTYFLEFPTPWFVDTSRFLHVSHYPKLLLSILAS